MSNSIQSAMVRYNANSRDINTGDCVKRALTIAYGMDYDQVASELNRIKRALGYEQFNIEPVYEQFIKRNGLEWSGTWHDMSGAVDDHITVKEFCEICPTGVYILLCGGSRKHPDTHLVCVIDGDFWDSWDSSTQYVGKIYTIRSGSKTEFSEVTVHDVKDEIIQHVQDCINKSQAKMPYAIFTYGEVDVIDKYSIQQRIVCKIDDTKVGGRIYAWMHSFYYDYTIKVNPRLSLEDNLKSLKSKLWNRVREWAYAIRKEIEDIVKSQKVVRNPDFHGDAVLLAKLPEWCHALVTYACDNGEGSYYDRYEVAMEALPDDPRIDREPKVRFYSETLTDLRRNIEDYRENFNRFGYDY